MKTKSILIASVAFISLFGAAASYAGTAPQKAMHAKRHHFKGMIAHLQPAQKQKLSVIGKKLRKQVMPMKKELHTLRISLDGKLVNRSTQWKNVKPIVTKMNRIHQKMSIDGTKARMQAFKATGLLLPARAIAHVK